MKKFFLALPLVAILLVRAPLGLLTILLGVAVVLTGMTALNLVACSLWPSHVARSRMTLERFPLRSFLVGLLILVSEVFLVQRLPVLALVALVANLVWLAQGLPALAGRVGQGMASGERRATACGTATLGLVMGVPVLGWLAGVCLGLSALGAPLAGER